MPCHHALAEALHAYTEAAGIAEDSKGFLFRTSPRHKASMLAEKPIAQPDAWRMVRRLSGQWRCAGACTEDGRT